MTSTEINYLSSQINNIKENLIELSHRLSKLEKNKWNYSTPNNPYNRLLKREEIIEFLVRLDTPENNLTEITNYKQLLEDKLKDMNYKDKLQIISVHQFFKQNNISEMTDEQKLIKNNILELVKQRQEDYNNRKKAIE
jgi:hypothetical protein